MVVVVFDARWDFKACIPLPSVLQFFPSALSGPGGYDLDLAALFEFGGCLALGLQPADP